MITKEQLSVLTGSAVVDRDGVEAGVCTDVYVDDRTDQPAWVAISLPDGSMRCAPLDDATMDDQTLHMGCTVQQVAAAPAASGRDEIDAALEADLRRHYGLRDIGAGAAVGADGTRAAGWEAEGDFATGMRHEVPGEMPGAMPAGSPTEMQARLQPDLGTNRPLERDLVEGGEGVSAPDATPGRRIEHEQGLQERQAHLHSWHSSMG